MQTDSWKSRLLIAASIHCGLWGLFIMGWPAVSFGVYGYAFPLTDTLVWRGCGFAIFMYGLGYALAATDPHRHFGLVLIGTVAKCLGTAGVVYGFLTDQLLWSALVWVVFNDVLWILPFGVIVRDAIREGRKVQDVTLTSKSHHHGVWFDWLGT